MKYFHFKCSLKSAIFSLFLLVSACGWSVPPQPLTMSYVPTLEGVVVPKFAGTDIKVHVSHFSDARAANGLDSGELDTSLKSVPASGDVGGAVKSALEGYLRKKGAELRAFNAPTITGEVREWRLEQEATWYGAKMKAIASIDVSVVDKLGKVVYAGTFSGTTTVTDPVPTNRKAERLLASAMSHAVKEAMVDPELGGQLQKAST